MALLVDTSVWSLAYRRDSPPDIPEVHELRRALTQGRTVATTGVILLELLRGFLPDFTRETILNAFHLLTFIEPERNDYIDAASLANTCRSVGIQMGSVDALLAQVARSRNLTLLTTDRDFHLASAHVDLSVWTPQ